MLIIAKYHQYHCTQTQGWSALHIAAYEEKLEIMEVITKYASEYGIDIMSLRDKVYYTVLLYGSREVQFFSASLALRKRVVSASEEEIVRLRIATHSWAQRNLREKRFNGGYAPPN